jgi:hypothetical protein
MTFTDRLVLWFHVAFVIFTIGPVTLATMSSPRAIRKGNLAVLRYLSWITRIFGAGTLGVLAFGMVLGQSLKDLGKVWLTVSITLFAVALVLLLLIMRDQRRAMSALELAAKDARATAGAQPVAGGAGSGDSGAADEAPPADGEPAATAPSAATAPPAGATSSPGAHVASVERGRIASMAGVVSLLWLAILVLMVWNGSS